MRSFKNFFLRRRTSEKMLLTSFILIGLVIWGSSFWTRGRVFSTEVKAKKSVLTEQKTWIDREPDIEKITAQALSTLRPEKSLNEVALLARLDQIRIRAGLNQGSVNAKTGA